MAGGFDLLSPQEVCGSPSPKECVPGFSTGPPPALFHVPVLDLYDDEKPFVLLYDVEDHDEDRRMTNLVFEPVEKEVKDIRDSDRAFTLNENGFTIVRQRSELEGFTEREVVEDRCLPEMERMLREVVEDFERVVWFDWRAMRSRRPNPRLAATATRKTKGFFDLNDYTEPLLPATYCHIDQSPSAVLSRVQLQLSDEAEELLQRRVRIINAWRPHGNVVEDYPLALCDAGTASPADFLEADNVRRHYTGATRYGMDGRTHQWYYLSQHSPEEVLLFKTLDSGESVAARFCPHAEIKIPGVSPGVPSRKRIELRALVFSAH
ncbi:uncharacterized protein PV07_07066 [Cladophialophora immunda]|uniref:Methyltransferase CmcJ n=1 Tax=Cladophialophora immunda TaxID=569365 RepID=A0A0D2CA55_9EURO|nr:uncharacterized protein PV07_07066 [Cladophialophora immunda]KIW27315.1 hypothetical protein PV07_07066 [Cladophialophora immunda]